ncbi:hypothetical protein DFS34DRAFT_635870 [Phlyctochytrium arcticum]|nr:hypothetical protein DFS34DRAFT_635870 [Phlyctochytrium arcticum]
MMASNEIPRGALSRASTAPDVLRSRNKKRDDAIRKKVEQELSRKTGRRTQTSTTSKRVKSGTVSSLRPAPAIIILETARIVQAAQLMAAKRADAVLAVNEEGALVGILTDKDIAYRVVAEGLDVRATLVSAVMTRNPISVYDKGNRNEALNIMVSRRFRHLPVISDGASAQDEDMDDDNISGMGAGTSVVGLLDITKCVFERIDDLERKVNEDENIINAMEALERRGSVASEHVGLMRQQHGCPDVGTVLSQMNVDNIDDDVPGIGVKATVRDAARVMASNHQTAVLVSAGEADERIGGIFTTKDIVLRVLAASLDPNTTSVVRVMTPHPDSVSTETSILEALKKLHAGHYLHLPVVEGNTPVGLVDVMTLTISMLTYIMTKETAKDGAINNNNNNAEAGPMWNNFWNSTFAGSNVETESDRLSAASDSIVSSAMSYPAPTPSERSYSARHHQPSPYPSEQAYLPPARSGEELSVGGGSNSYMRSSTEDTQFAFKLRDGRTGKVYRFTSRTDSMAELSEKVRIKCGLPESTALSTVDDGTSSIATHTPASDLQLNYIDDEGDIIAITNDKDLEEGVDMARGAGWKRLLIFYGELPDANRLIEEETTSSTGSSPLVLRRKSGGRPNSSSLDFDDQDHLQHRQMIPNPHFHPAHPAPAPAKEESGVMNFLRDAPLPVNVAISAGIMVVAGLVFVKLAK